MNHNLLRPYSDTCSPPQTPWLSFFCPQSEDLLFEPKENGSVHPIELICQAGLRSVGLRWTLHRTSLAKPFLTGVGEPLTGNRFRIVIDPANFPSGFFDLRVELDSGVERSVELNGRPVTGVCTFGWRADNLPVQDSRPEDFANFWKAAAASNAELPLDPQVESSVTVFASPEIDIYNKEFACLPADYDPTGHKTDIVESYKVSFAGPDGGRVYAWLAKPLGAGPFPAMLVLPGAGFNGRPRPLEHARHGYLTIDIQVHGQEVDRQDNPVIRGHYDEWQCDPPEAYYYYNVHRRVLQAVDFLVSRPEVDPRRIAAVGGSQGGRLGIVAAGLDKRIGAVVATIVNSPNYPHLAWVARCNAHSRTLDPTTKPGAPLDELSDGMDQVTAPPIPTDLVGKCMAYYDPMNFAPDITRPVLMGAGLIDNGSPPYSTWGVYNRLGSRNKSVIAMPGIGHDWSAEFDRRAWRWLDDVFAQQAESKTQDDYALSAVP